MNSSAIVSSITLVKIGYQLPDTMGTVRMLKAEVQMDEEKKKPMKNWPNDSNDRKLKI
jgi:hypothetical protein